MFPFFNGVRWYTIHGPSGLVFVKYNRKTSTSLNQYILRQLSNDPKYYFLEHKNGNQLDFQTKNLYVTTRQKAFQQYRRNNAKYIYWREVNQKYRVEIQRKRIGERETMEQAIALRDQYLKSRWETKPIPILQFMNRP